MSEEPRPLVKKPIRRRKRVVRGHGAVEAKKAELLPTAKRGKRLKPKNWSSQKLSAADPIAALAALSVGVVRVDDERAELEAAERQERKAGQRKKQKSLERGAVVLQTREALKRKRLVRENKRKHDARNVRAHWRVRKAATRLAMRLGAREELAAAWVAAERLNAMYDALMRLRAAWADAGEGV